MAAGPLGSLQSSPLAEKKQKQKKTLADVKLHKIVTIYSLQLFIIFFPVKTRDADMHLEAG